MARNPWHDLHFTEARAIALVEAGIDVAISWLLPSSMSVSDSDFAEMRKAGLVDGLARALAITYPPSTRGSMGGFAKQRALDATEAEQKARRLADRRRKARSRAVARERAAILRLHAAEQSIGTTRITR